MKKIIFLFLSVSFVFVLSCTKENTVIKQNEIIKDTIRVDFGYSVTYNHDTSTVNISASDASNNVPNGSSITWYCNGQLPEQSGTNYARWQFSTINIWGQMSITEIVTVGSNIHSAVHSFTVLN